jgi:hypothetical protein
MFNLDELQTLCFAMTEVPDVGGQQGAYEEKGANGASNAPFFEISFAAILEERKRGKSLPTRTEKSHFADPRTSL